MNRCTSGSRKFGHVRHAPKAEALTTPRRTVAGDGAAVDVIQAPQRQSMLLADRGYDADGNYAIRGVIGNRMVRSAPAAIRRDALIGHPHAIGQFAGLPEH